MLVLSCDEKSQCQALERTQLPLPPGLNGKVRTGTHNYIRHGTITLFAVLNYMDGRIHRQTAKKHTHVEGLAFLKQLDREADPDVALHLILDNYATHKHPVVRRWIKWRNDIYHKIHGMDCMVLHFTPTSSSWINLVERFFRDLTVDCVRDGSFSSVGDLIKAMEAYLTGRDLNPVRYRWKAEAAVILENIQRDRVALAKAKAGSIA